jgi:serine/threonine protein kinase
MDQPSSALTKSQKVRHFEDRWSKLCTTYLPVSPECSMWSYSRESSVEDPEQGWKLHISATVLNAHLILRKVGSILAGRGIQYKAPSSLQALHRLNTGLQESYSQVGKVITVYPRTTREAVSLARQLHKITLHFVAPTVPFDHRYRAKGNLYYRYGAFKALEIELPKGRREPAIRDFAGNLIPDVARSEIAPPAWVEDPFARNEPQASVKSNKITKPSFRVFRALSQRGKGGVYHAFDMRGEVPRLCLLKEGRIAGEVGWDGRDGRWRVRHEKKVLTILRKRGLNVPRIYTSFESSGNYYLVTEFIEGESLHSFLLKRQRRITVAKVLRLAIDLSSFIAQIHATGWVWRDCKPANLILTKTGQLRALDFEGACPIGQQATTRWTTPAFASAKKSSSGESGINDDLHALGSVIYLLLSGRLPKPGTSPPPVSSLRRNVPRELYRLVSRLLDSSANSFLDAQVVTAKLRAQLHRLDSKKRDTTQPVLRRGRRELKARYK